MDIKTEYANFGTSLFVNIYLVYFTENRRCTYNAVMVYSY